MATLETEIEAALYGRLATLTLAPAWPVAWPDKAFTPPANGRYLRVFHLPGAIARQYVGAGPHQRRGILQVSVVVPIGQEYVARETAGLVAAHFPADLKLGSNAIMIRRTPAVAPRYEDGPSWVIPVSIDYECWA